jgi:hypothetical protein
MRILVSFVFSSLLCMPLMAMDVQEKTTESQLKKLFATAKSVCPTKLIEKFKWNPQGTHLAITSLYERPFILDVRNNSVSPMLCDEQYADEKYPADFIGDFAWNMDGTRLAITTRKQTIFIVDVAKGLVTRKLQTPDSPPCGCQLGNQCTGLLTNAPVVAWSPNDATVLACGFNGGINKRVSIPEETDSRIQALSTIDIAQSPNVKWISGTIPTYGTGRPKGVAWQKNSGPAFAYEEGAWTEGVNLIPCHQGQVASRASNAVACHPQEKIVACAFKNPATIVIYSPDEKKVLHKADFTCNGPYPAPHHLSYSFDGHLLTSVHLDCLHTRDVKTLLTLHMHRLSTKRPRASAEWSPTRNQIAFTDNGQLFITQESETSE